MRRNLSNASVIGTVGFYAADDIGNNCFTRDLLHGVLLLVKGLVFSGYATIANVHVCYNFHPGNPQLRIRNPRTIMVCTTINKAAMNKRIITIGVQTLPLLIPNILARKKPIK